MSVGDKTNTGFGFFLHCEFASNWHHPHQSLKSVIPVFKARTIKPGYCSEILNSWWNIIALVSDKSSCRDMVGTGDPEALLQAAPLTLPSHSLWRMWPEACGFQLCNVSIAQFTGSERSSSAEEPCQCSWRGETWVGITFTLSPSWWGLVLTSALF